MDIKSQEIKNFFYENQDYLLEAYPGINLSYFEETFLLFIENPKHIDDKFKSLFNWSLDNISNFKNLLLNGVPLQYITGKAYFYSLCLKVSPEVLIPRFETEILVEMALEELSNLHPKVKRPVSVIDIGTGSGAIILAILKESKVPISAFASDICSSALNIAEINYKQLKSQLKILPPVEVFCTDRLSDINQTFDVIVSNPPYIMENLDRQTTHLGVIKYEPHRALFLNDFEYFKWFEVFFKQISEALNPEGVVLIEGHENHLQELKNIAIKIGFKDVSVIQDYTDRDRFLRMKKNG